MTKLNNDEMSQIMAAGCGFYRRRARKADRQDRNADALAWMALAQEAGCV